MRKLYKIRAQPKLKSPIMLAAWPGIANVATIVANYLMYKLEFKELAELNPANFFDPIGVIAKNGVVESPQFPRSRFFYWKHLSGLQDIIVFLGDDQPVTKTYEFAHQVLEVAEHFGVKRIYTSAAAITRIHHTEQPRVWVAATQSALLSEIENYQPVIGSNLQISGMNGLLLGVAKDKNIEGICLLGEVPSYASKVSNPMAALVIIRVLAQILEIKLDFNELIEQATEVRERMKEVAAEAMGDYIDYFTEPIWESGEYEQDEEEDDFQTGEN
jgi:proteasome assembly chaperone (PAC2) family protein